MANHKSAIKRIRVTARRHERNRTAMSRTRTDVRSAREALQAAKAPNAQASNAETARAAVLHAIRTLDKAAESGLIHKNNAARRKSRLMKQLAKVQG